MHELGIAQDLFKIVKEKARGNNLKKVTKIRIKVGVASGIEKDFLRHSFIDHISPSTFAEGAKLEFIKEPVEARCKNCGKKIDTQDKFTPLEEKSLTGFTVGCPACGSVNIEIIRGRDIYLENIEGD